MKEKVLITSGRNQRSCALWTGENDTVRLGQGDTTAQGAAHAHRPRLTSILTDLSQSVFQFPGGSPSQSCARNPIKGALPGEAFQIFRQRSERSLAAIVMPKEDAVIGHHSCHLERIVLNVNQIVSRIDQAELHRIGVGGGIKLHGVAKDLLVTGEPKRLGN